MSTRDDDQAGSLIKSVGEFPEKSEVGLTVGLIEAVEGLSERLEVNTARTEELGSAQRSQRRIIFWAGVVVVLIAIGLSLFIVIKDNTANDKIRANTDEISAIQDRTSNEVLCPLYRLILQAEPRSIGNPALTKDQKDELTRTYAVIHQGFTALRCKE